MRDERMGKSERCRRNAPSSRDILEPSEAVDFGPLGDRLPLVEKLSRRLTTRSAPLEAKSDSGGTVSDMNPSRLVQSSLPSGP